MMTNQTETTSKKPTHTAYILKPKADSEQLDWIKISSAWEHGDTDGLNLPLNILGQTIQVIIRRNKPKV